MLIWKSEHCFPEELSITLKRTFNSCQIWFITSHAMLTFTCSCRRNALLVIIEWKVYWNWSGLGLVVESELAKTSYWLGWCCSRRGVWRGDQASFIQLERDTMWWGFLLFHSGEIAWLWHALIIPVIPVTHWPCPYKFLKIVKSTSPLLYDLTQSS